LSSRCEISASRAAVSVLGMAKFCLIPAGRGTHPRSHARVNGEFTPARALVRLRGCFYT
jgi:hypothetical protein